MAKSRKCALRSQSGSVADIAGVRRWSAEQAQLVIAAAEASGLSKRAFAQREGLDPQRLTRWEGQLGGLRASRPSVAFEEIRLDAGGVNRRVEERASVAPFEVVLRGGRVVRVAASFEEGALLRLVRALERVAC